jgi:hypothetical protein
MLHLMAGSYVLLLLLAGNHEEVAPNMTPADTAQTSVSMQPGVVAYHETLTKWCGCC